MTSSPLDDALIDGTRRALARHGARGATMERIATEAGISRMTLHRRGVSKDDLLRAVGAKLESEYREAFWPALVQEGPAADRLRGALERQCALADANLELLEALSAAEHDAIFHERGPGSLARPAFIEALARLLRDGAKDGSLAGAAEDADETATVLLNLVGHTYRHLRSSHGWSHARARDTVVAMAIDGARAR
jgi:AcrR family transcriptional regulator